MHKILIVGLGNPGISYNYTPHNAGFGAVDKLKKNLEGEGFTLKTKNTKRVTIYEGSINGVNVVISKPLLFMNNSGVIVKLLIEKYGIKNVKSDLWVIHDDIDLPLSSVKISKKSGSAGHNGVQDIINKISSKNFVRFRMGVLLPNMPQKRSAQFTSNFVTKKLARKERKILEEVQNECARLIRANIELL